jgi:alpha-1,3-glucosyltransferase
MFSVYVLAVSIKILIFWGFHSVDFEVHRNWMAITYNLPMSQWYYDETSSCTLDYPPFFAYFEYFLGWGATWIEPEMVKVRKESYESYNCILYLRVTVILSELVLVYGLSLYSDTFIFALVLLNPGLIYVDSIFYIDIHFQYNGMLLGLALISIYLVNKEKYIQGGIIYSILIMFKHIYLYYV